MRQHTEYHKAIDKLIAKHIQPKYHKEILSNIKDSRFKIIYSNNLESAITLIHTIRLEPQFQNFKISCQTPNEDPIWQVTLVENFDGIEAKTTIKMDELPLAICIAILQARGISIPDPSEINITNSIERNINE